MPRLTRRAFLAGSAAAVATPALGAPVPAEDFDVVVIGAGAAGIAAARRLATSGRRFVVLEASDRIGGRCITDTSHFGVPFDRGAHWVHEPRINPLAKLARGVDIELYPAPRVPNLRIGRRGARTSELEAYLAARERADRAIERAARGKTDVSCARAMPGNLGPWRQTADFVLGPFSCGKDLDEVSARDFARSRERSSDAFAREGYGTLLERLAKGLPIRLSTPVRRIEWGSRLAIETDAGRIEPKHVIVTASTEMLLSERIAFEPALPKGVSEALGQLRLGSYDHIALELSGNPLDAGADQLIIEQSSGVETAAVLANAAGSALAMVEVGGRFGRSLSGQGEAAMVEFAVEWLAGLYGASVKRALGRSLATRWNAAPWIGGAFSAAAPGGQGARQVLTEPLRERVFFAGEAAHETLWGTVAGAWESGERAADATLKLLTPPPAKPATKSTAKPTRPKAKAKSRPRRAAPARKRRPARRNPR